MSRIIFSNVNDKKIYKNIKDDYNKYFQIYNEYKGDHYSISTFKKLKKETKNMIVYDNDIIANTGTLFYKDSIGSEALEKIYDSININNINEISKNIFGNFSIIIKKGTNIYFFVDNMGIYKLYYSLIEREITITNIFYNLAKNMENNLTINEQSLLEDSFQYSILGEETFVNEIKRVSGNYIYKYDLIKKELLLIEKELNIEGYNHEDIEKSAKYLSSIIKDKIKIINNNFNNITINMTGGLDSRLILSAFLSEGIKPNITYGIGDSPLTNTKDKDLALSEICAEKFKLKFHKMNWKTKENFIEDWDYLLEKYGEYYILYSGNINIFEEYENKVSKFTDFIEFGYFGETLRNIEKLENSKSIFDIDYYIENLYLYNLTNLEKFLVNPINYKYEIKEKLNKILSHFNLNSKELNQKNFQKIHTEYRKSADSKMSNIQNQIMYSCVILSDYEIQEFVNDIPFEWKKDAKFMLKVINNLEPEVLKIPFFSHTKDWVFDEKNFKLVPKNKHTIKNAIKRIIKNKTVYYSLKKIYNFFKQNKNEKNNIKYYKNDLVKEVSFLQKELDIKLIYPDKYEGDIRALMRYYQNLYMLKKFLKINDLEE